MRAFLALALSAGCLEPIHTSVWDDTGASPDTGPADGGTVQDSAVEDATVHPRDAQTDAGCTPDCVGRTCGLDPVCGVVCGTCSDGTGCALDGTCQPTCAPGTTVCVDPGGEQSCGLNPNTGLHDLGPRIGCSHGCAGDGCIQSACVPTEIIVVLDRSASTSVNSVWSWSADAVETSVSHFQHNSAFGFVEFPATSCGASGALPPAESAAGAIRQVMTPPSTEASSPIHHALQTAYGALSTPSEGRAVVLITDGEETCRTADDVIRLVSESFRQGVRTYALGVSPAANAAFLDEIAAVGGTDDRIDALDQTALEAALDDVFAEMSACRNRSVKVTAGYYHACALGPDDTIACWGRNLDGQATAPTGNFIDVAAGTDHVCAINATGGPVCWGRAGRGQTTPVPGTYQQITAGDSHTCGLRTDGTVACWGYDDAGQASPPPGEFKQVAAAAFTSCGIRMDDTVDCWGGGSLLSDTYAQISGGSFHYCGLRIDGSIDCSGAPVGTFSSIEAGDDHNCAIHADGTLQCWGSDAYGQVSGAPSGTVVSVAANNGYTCAALADGEIVCFGEGGNGQTTPIVPW